MTKEKKIIHNCARCLKCGDVLESRSTHDKRTCNCGNLTVDGGTEYIRRCFKEEDSYEELSVEEGVDKQSELAYLKEKGWLAPENPRACIGNGNFPEGYYHCDICEYEKQCFPEQKEALFRSLFRSI